MMQVHVDQIEMVYGTASHSLIASLLNSGILAFLLWPVVDRTLLIAWVLVTGLISLLRLGLSIRFHRIRPNVESIDVWSTWALAGALLAGLGWGAASYFLFVFDSLPHQVFLAFVIAGTSAGAVATLAARRSAVFGFILLATLPLSYRFSQETHQFAVAMSLMVMFFALVMVLTAHRYNLNLTEMLVERYRRRKAQRQDGARNQVLELLATGAPLGEALEAIIRNVELEDSEMLCSILLSDQDEKHLLFGAAPSLPDIFKAQVHGLEIGPDAGFCAEAAFTRQRVVVEDMRTLPSYAPHRDITEKAGLRSCWSEPLFSSHGRLLGIFTFYRRDNHTPDDQELSAVKQAIKLAGISIEQNQSAEALRLAASIYQNTSEAMMITDEENRIVAINPAFTDVTGYGEAESLGRDPGFLASGSHDAEFFQSLWNTLAVTGQWRGEIWNRRKNGEEFAEWMVINTIYDSERRVHRRVSLFSDITERKKADTLIWQQANYDSLTQLPNRRLFADRLDQGIKVAHRERSQLALLFIDLDRFKEVNDTLGHHIGDELLMQAAQRIKRCVRESDTVARLGGDEFTVILNELHDISHIRVVSEKIIDALNEPFNLRGEQAFISASIGVTVYPDDALSAAELLKNADQAMFAAKQSGRNRLNYFTKSMQEAAQQRMLLIRDIHQGLVEDQFSVFYQPIVALANGHIHKAEALLRWRHPQRGYISPAAFIPVAEETGAIHEIGNRVFMAAARQVKEWRSHYDPNFQVSINASPVQFLVEGPTQNDWLARLQELGVSPKGIVIEITEGVLLKGAANTYEKLLRLRDAGMEVAIDDFGTGYSSLAYLKRFDIDYLKIDQSFVRNLETDASDLALSEAIVVMAHKLGLRVIAEGVETEAQRDILKEIGCDYAQGYLFAKPIPANEFELLMKSESSKANAA